MKIRNILLVFFIIIFLFNVLIIGSSAKTITGFVVSEKVLKFSFDKGGYSSFDLEVINQEDRQKKITVVSYNPNQFFKIVNNEITLEKGESGNIEILVGRDDLSSGIYIGKIELHDGESSFSIPVILGVNTKDSILGLDLVLAQNSFAISLNEEINVDFFLFNFGDNSFVSFSYGLSDLEGNILYENEKIVNVNGKASFREEIKVPVSFSDDLIIVWSKITQEGSTSTDAEIISFSNDLKLSPVVEKDYSFLISFFVLVFLVFSIIVLSYYWNRRVILESRDWRKKMKNIKNIKFSDARRALRKLMSQKHSLKIAYEQRFISDKSYKEGLKEINELVDKLKKRL